jgi:hypothetical protein
MAVYQTDCYRCLALLVSSYTPVLAPRQRCVRDTMRSPRGIGLISDLDQFGVIEPVMPAFLREQLATV